MRWRKTIWILAAGVLVAACGGGDAEPSAVTVAEVSPTSTTASTTTEASTDDASVEAAVERAFHEQWDAFIEILSDPDPANPLIDRYFTGAARETLLDTISSDVRNGYITQRPEDSSHFRAIPLAVTVTSDREARVDGCVVDGLVLKVRGTGEVVNDEVVTVESRNTFVLEDGWWKLERSVQESRVGGLGGCADE